MHLRHSMKDQNTATKLALDHFRDAIAVAAVSHCAEFSGLIDSFLAPAQQKVCFED